MREAINQSDADHRQKEKKKVLGNIDRHNGHEDERADQPQRMPVVAAQRPLQLRDICLGSYEITLLWQEEETREEEQRLPPVVCPEG